ncbi:UNVERIFIED_CONTAM: hypothetical protein FKN15_013418 [Acipenser sinensis]
MSNYPSGRLSDRVSVAWSARSIDRDMAAHRYHPCADSGGVKMNTRCPPKRVPSADLFFTRCRLTVQPPLSYSFGGQRSPGQLTGKPAGARPDHRGRWCAVCRGHPGRPNPLWGFFAAFIPRAFVSLFI